MPEDWRTDGPHEHCWHDRELHREFVARYRQCCRCDVTPEDTESTKAKIADFRRHVTVLRAELERPLLVVVTWLDRQLRRSPRLYRWMS